MKCPGPRPACSRTTVVRHGFVLSPTCSLNDERARPTPASSPPGPVFPRTGAPQCECYGSSDADDGGPRAWRPLGRGIGFAVPLIVDENVRSQFEAYRRSVQAELVLE